MNWFSQIAALIEFNLRTLPRRKGSAIAAMFGIAGVVAVLVGVLSIGQGFKKVMESTGAADSAIVLYNRTRINNRAIADGSIRIDYAPGHQDRTRTYDRRAGNNRRWVPGCDNRDACRRTPPKHFFSCRVASNTQRHSHAGSICFAQKPFTVA